jgi:hypothetical protein
MIKYDYRYSLGTYSGVLNNYSNNYELRITELYITNCVYLQNDGNLFDSDFTSFPQILGVINVFSQSPLFRSILALVPLVTNLRKLHHLADRVDYFA